MLHGMIPAAFFATLLRRYLDSLSETPEYSAASSSTVGCLGTSAVIATVGMAAYGLSRLSKRKNEIQTPDNDVTTPITPEKKESSLRVNRKPTPRKVTRKHRKKDKDKWFLKHMKHYKSKYGRKIGKLMNQLLGVPLDEPQDTEMVDLGASDEEDLAEDTFQVFTNSPFSGHIEETDALVEETCLEDDEPAHPKHRFGEDDEEDVQGTGAGREVSSSLDLNNLLRNNFEMQRSRLMNRRSFESIQTISSTETCRSSSSRHSRLSSNKGRSPSCSKSYRKAGEKRRRKRPRTTRSGRCYNIS